MWFALALFTLVAYVDATSNTTTTQCPTSCNCQVSSSFLAVDCAQRPAIIVDEKHHLLSNELDRILSTDYMVNHLTSLSITNTPLTHVPTPVCKLVNLTSLNLDRNKFTKLPDDCFTKLTKLVTLSMKWNSITGLQDGLFDGMQSLVTLNLSCNHIAFIGRRMFSNASDLTSLRSLDLSWNSLTSLEPWWYYRCILGNKNSPVTVDLHNNLISNFTNNLKFEYRCGMKPLFGYLNLNHNRISHLMDIANGWNIGGHDNGRRNLLITGRCLYNWETVHSHYMAFSVATSVNTGVYKCDCTDFVIYRLVKFIPRNRILDHVLCSNFDNISELMSYNLFSRQLIPAKTVPLIKFVCELSNRCPSGCRCVYRPANATLHVYCSGANLSSLPLELPRLPKSYVKYKLDFSNNKLLHHLEHRPYFVNTSILDVSNCGLVDIDPGVLKGISQLNVVNLRGNMIQTFPRNAHSVNISARLLMGVNPWRCSCDNSWIISWLQSLSDQITDPGDIVCRSPSRMYGRNVLKSTMEDFCVDPVKRVLIILLSTVSSVVFVVFLLIITGILIYKLRVKFFRRWKFHPFDRDECVGEDMDYDVFLCCSSEDHNFHGLRILREMESNGYRVCYHLRDFLAGVPITDNMIQSIERSKRTVCLISNNFLRRLVITLFHNLALL